ncbi:MULTISPECIES: hypothetical protein [Thalassospira]|uniref:hypothetical protein n=1 Tax=Thalassospira TaxID=168934 RepID=UPI00080F71DF|nr:MULTISPECIES: hypothetical protein [Thalassospira]OCK05876.1 hypothetical protein KO164_0053 [Thalassospira sp. KO164]
MAWLIIGVQMAVASMMYICHFELQRVAGPVFLSQIGYVMALTSLAGGTLLLGETLRPELIVTLACVVAGTFLVRPARHRIVGHRQPVRVSMPALNTPLSKENHRRIAGGGLYFGVSGGGADRAVVSLFTGRHAFVFASFDCQLVDARHHRWRV